MMSKHVRHIFVLLFFFAAACGSVNGDRSTAACSKSAGLSQMTSFNAVSPTSVVSNRFFGMQETNLALHGFPTVNVGTWRIWDPYPGVTWPDINTSRGVFSFSNMDALVNEL